MGKDRLAELQAKNLEAMEERRHEEGLSGEAMSRSSSKILVILEQITKIDSEYMLKLTQDVEQIQQLQVDLLLFGKEDRQLERIFNTATDLHWELKSLMSLIIKHGKFRLKHKLMVTSHLDRLSKEINRVMKVFRAAHIECMELEQKKSDEANEDKEENIGVDSVDDSEELLIPDMESWDRILRTLDQSIVEVDQLLLLMEQGRSLTLTPDELVADENLHQFHLKQFKRRKPMMTRKRCLIGLGVAVGAVVIIVIIIIVVLVRKPS